MSVGKYTVNEVEERTKVPASTLRQWERRYGFPKPERSESGYRLYSDVDIRHIEAMKRHIADGIPASRAADLAKRAQPTSGGPRPAAAFKDRLVSALLDLDDAAADRVLSEAHALHSVETVMLEVMQRTMIDLGKLWHDGEINTTTEHFASSYLLGKLRTLLGLAANQTRGPSVVVACAPEDQHELGALTLAVMLRRRGHQVYYIGANTPVADLLELADDVDADAVMISASVPDALPKLEPHRDALREIAPLLVFGGAAFDQQPDAAAHLGGTYLSRDVSAALERFEELLDTGKAQPPPSSGRRPVEEVRGGD